MHVLLIGAYRLLVKALKQGLEEEGFTVAVAHDAAEGDLRLRTAAYHVLILDLTPPQEAGLALLRRWRRAGLQTPVLVLTGPGTDDRTGALDAGANDWLTKPFELEELLARLRAVAGSINRDRPQAPGGECFLSCAFIMMMRGRPSPREMVGM